MRISRVVLLGVCVIIGFETYYFLFHAGKIEAPSSSEFQIIPAQLDYGIIKAGEETTRSFTLKNQSQSSMRFAAKASCGCTGVLFPDGEKVDAGASIPFLVKVRTIKNGPLNVNIVFEGVDGILLQLKLTGCVLPEDGVYLNKNAFMEGGVIENGGTAGGVFEVYGLPSRLNILKFSSNSPNLVIEPAKSINNLYNGEIVSKKVKVIARNLYKTDEIFTDVYLGKKLVQRVPLRFEISHIESTNESDHVLGKIQRSDVVELETNLIGDQKNYILENGRIFQVETPFPLPKEGTYLKIRLKSDSKKVGFCRDTIIIRDRRDNSIASKINLTAFFVDK